MPFGLVMSKTPPFGLVMPKTPPTILAVVVGLMLAIAPSAFAAGPAYRGVNAHPLQVDDPATMTRELDAARELGANTVRVDVSWPSFEPRARGQYDEGFKKRVDRLMQAAAARRIKVLAVVLGTPCWAVTPSPAPPQCSIVSPGSLQPPLYASDYGRFLRWFATRYRRYLAAIEVWNEPNHGGFFQAADRPREYTKLVKAAYPAIKAVAPEVKVLAGATSGSDADFLRGLYYNHIRGYYDAISIHPYTGDGAVGPDAPVPAEQEKLSFLQGIKLIRRTQRAAGDTTPLWLTEFGWNTGAYRNMTLTPWLNGVDEATQARYLGRALGLLDGPGERLGYVQGATIYTLTDTVAGAAALGNYGLLRGNLTRKPSFSAVRRGFAAIQRSRRLERFKSLRARL